MKITPKQKVFFILCLTTIFDFILIWYRNQKIGFEWNEMHSIRDIANFRSVTFLFLVWNLFLAWVPYWIALAINWMDKIKAPKILIFLALGFWLLFFPNAPYIITDLLHLKHRPPIPMWYDLLLLFSFAWTGLILAYSSLIEVQAYLRKYTNWWTTWTIPLVALILSGFGIYIGRFQRWNSWDILTRPNALFADIYDILSHPIANLNTLGMAVILAVMLVLGYLTLIILGHQTSQAKGYHQETPIIK